MAARSRARSAAARSADAVDLTATVVPLRVAAVGVNGYGAIDRYRDMRAVFLSGDATPEQRERVLYQVLDLCSVNKPFADLAAVDHGERKVWVAAGRQQVGLTLLGWLTEEPQSGR